MEEVELELDDDGYLCSTVDPRRCYWLDDDGYLHEEVRAAEAELDADGRLASS